MSFGRWLLVHSFSIFLVMMFLLGYVYREELQLNEVYRQLLDSTMVAESPQPAEEPAATGDQPQQPPAGPAEAERRSPVVPEPAQPPASSGEAGLQPAESAAPPTVPAEKFPPADETPDTVLGSTPTVSRTIIELDDLLFKARKAYWDKDYQTAIFYYQQLIEDDGDNADYIGELGNIYYSINDFDNAAQQYYQAAIILIARGKLDQARALVSPVTAMNRDLGDQLRRKLQQY